MNATTSTRFMLRTAACLAAGTIGLLGALPLGVAQAAPAPARRVTIDPVDHVQIKGSLACDRDTTTDPLNPVTNCNLLARSGNVNVDTATSLPVWVFDDSSVDQVDLVNPVLEVVEGDVLHVTVTNASVPTEVSFSMPVVPGAPEMAGVGIGGTTEFISNRLVAGTYLYQAGPTPTGARQIAMGMAGVVIVRPAEFTTDGAGPTVDLTETYNDTDFTIDVVVADDSAVDLVEWFVTGSDLGAGLNTEVTAPITGLAVDSDISVRAFDTVGNVTIVSGIITADPVAFAPTATSTVGDQYTNSHRLDASRGETAFLDEILALTNEFDPALNADPLGYDIAQYTPSIFTINGQSHEGGALPQLQAGTSLLIRAANLGLAQRRIGFADTRLTQWTANSRLLGRPADVAAVTVPPGEVVDLTAVLPAVAPINIALFDHGLSMFKGSSPAVAGQVQAWSLPGVGDPTGPKVSELRFAETIPGIPAGLLPPLYGPNDVIDGEWPFYFEANVTSQPGDANPSWRYAIDDVTLLDSAPQALVDPFGVGSSPYAVASSLNQFTLSTLSNGEHVLWVQAISGDGLHEGPVSGLVFEMDRSGPAINSLNATPSTMQAGLEVMVTGTADTTLTGPGSDVQAVRFEVFSTSPPPPALMTVAQLNNAATPELFTATFDGDNLARASFAAAVDTTGLTEGGYAVRIYAKDSYSTVCCGVLTANDHWSQVPGEITFVVDNTAPIVDTVGISPNPNDGATPFNGSQTFLPSVRLTATISEAAPVADSSPIVEAEFYIGGVGADGPGGSGSPLQSATANWGDIVDGHYVQNVFADIPLADIRSFDDGPIEFYVRGRDAAGNWSVINSVTFTLDRVAPTVELTSPSAAVVEFVVDGTGSPLALAGSPALVEWWIGADPGVGAGTQVTIADGLTFASGSIPGTGTISVRAIDAAGNTTVASIESTDTTGPVITVTNNGGGVIAFNVTDSQSGVASINWTGGGTLAGPPEPAVVGAPAIVSASAFVGPQGCASGYTGQQCHTQGYETGSNLAYQGNGFAQPAVASSTIGAGSYTIHQPQNVNDGQYGNGTSWIGNAASAWVKIDLGCVATVDGFTFGRDRTTPGYNDRDPGQIQFLVAIADDVYANGDSANDATEYSLAYDSGPGLAIAGPDTLAASFTPRPARYVKVLVATNGAALDEIEVSGTGCGNANGLSISGLADGTLISITATDVAGNVTTLAVTADFAPPVISNLVKAGLNVTFDVVDVGTGVARVEWYEVNALDPGVGFGSEVDISGGTTGLQILLSSTDQGTVANPIVIRAIDNGGNYSSINLP